MATLKLDGDAKGAVKAVGDVNRAQKELGETWNKVDQDALNRSQRLIQSVKNFNKEQAESARQAKATGAEIASIIRANENPQERYNRKVEELSRLFVRGKLSVEQMDRALARYRGELAAVAPAQDKAFGKSAVDNLVNYFSTLAGPAAVIGLATQALQNYKQEIDAIGQQLQGERGGLGQLMTLAAVEKTPEAREAKRQALVGEARSIFNMGTTTSLGQAGEFVYQLQQANLEPQHRKMLAEAAASGVLPEAMGTARSMAALRTAFPSLTPDQAIGQGIYAGIVSPGSVTELIEGAAKSAQQMKTLGWKPEFSLAATSFLTKAYPGQGEGATRLEQFGRQLERFGYQSDPSLKGMDPLQTLEHIGAKTQGGADRQMLEKYLGNRGEAIQGFRTLYSNREDLRALMGGTAMADGGFLDTAIGLANNTPEIAAARQSVSSRNQRASSRAGTVTTAQLIDSIRDQSAEGRGAFGTGAVDFMSFLTRLRGEGAMEDVLRDTIANPKTYGNLTPDLMEDIRRHLQNIDAKTQPAPPMGTGRPEK